MGGQINHEDHEQIVNKNRENHQRRSYHWHTFRTMINFYRLSKPKLYVSVFELKSTISYIL